MLGPVSLSERAARKLAQPFLDAVNSQAEIPVRDSRRMITLAQFIPEWRRLAAPSLKPSTLKGVESGIRNHILPLLGEKPLASLDARQYQELITTMIGTTARGTRENVICDLQMVLKAARKWHSGIPVVKKSDLYFGVKNPGEAKKVAYLTVPQVRAILAEVAFRKPWDAFFTLLALSGLRSNEILGLDISDVDFQNNLIWIRRGAWNGKIQTLKTPESENSIPMAPVVKEKLQQHLAGHGHQLLFVNKLGRPYNRGRIVKKILHPILDKLNIPRVGRRIGLHAFRHALASMLLQNASALVAQRQLRHANAKLTLEIYGHILGDDHTQAMNKIESVLMAPIGT